jgi:DNA mismatch repair protein MutS2
VAVDTTERRNIRAGDSVRLLALDQMGEVLAVEGNEAEVQLGSLKLRQPLDQLERLGRARSTTREATRITQTLTSEAIPIELDVRGHRVEEIGSIIEHYIQDAYLVGLPWVRIIHGKGTGALRQASHELLRDNPVVARHEQAGDKEGGDGATVAYLSER